VRVELGSTSKPAEQIALHYYEVEQDRKLDLLQKMLNEEQGSFLVFARTKHGADKLAKRLGQAGMKSAAIHGDRSQNQRMQALKGFQDGYYRVLVATDVAARGIHVEGISHVVNYDLPQAPEDFIHRVGRTGRAGTAGTASTFGSRSERGEVARIERALSLRLTRRDPGTGATMESTPVIVMPTGPERRKTVFRSIGRRRSFRRAV
jgi:ATP-dependent RNA helicase RhlE